MASTKDIKQLVKQLQDQGFEVTYARNGHYQARNPETGKKMQFASTPSDARSFKNVQLDLRRYIGFKPVKK